MTARPPREHAVTAAGAHADRAGALALLREAGRPFVVALSRDRAPSDDPCPVYEALLLASGPDRLLGEPELAHALASVEGWALARAARRLAGVAPLGAEARRACLRRIAATARRAPAHRRPHIAALAAAARRAATVPLARGAEEMLGELAAASMPDEDWLRAVAELGLAHARGTERAGEPGEPVDAAGAADASVPRLEALIVFG